MKRFYNSKTVRANIAGIFTGVGLIISGQENEGIALLIPSIINLALRFVTKEPVSIK